MATLEEINIRLEENDSRMEQKLDEKFDRLIEIMEANFAAVEGTVTF